MVQEFHVVRCFSCQTFQVQQVKKVNRWSCKLCGEKQSLLKEFGRGSGADCRRHVQKLNAMRGTMMEEQEQHTWSLWEPTRPTVHTQVEADGEDEPEEQVTHTQVSSWSKYLDTPEGVETKEDEEENVFMDRQQLHRNNMIDRKRKRRDMWTDGCQQDRRTPEQSNCFSLMRPVRPSDTTSHPSLNCTSVPSLNRTSHPSLNRTSPPSLNRTSPPSLNCTGPPSLNRTSHPSLNSTSVPSLNRTSAPSLNRTSAPSLNSTSVPSLNRTSHPSLKCPSPPSLNRTSPPSLNRTSPPSLNCTGPPSLNRTSHPSLNSTSVPSLNRTSAPSLNRTSHPSLNSTSVPSLNRTSHPSLKCPSPPSLNRTSPPIKRSITPSVSTGLASRWTPFLNHDYQVNEEGEGPPVSGWSQSVDASLSRPRPLLPVSSMFQSGDEFIFDDDFLTAERK